ncbi:ubiquitin carboxyl-terminal hydrolase family protein [Cryptosporidium muris RN66]|uniref:Ubiquitin carboxyl-terminal hydrolase n=1 Tax=Cryptosporidium muris (strain RN66) TaxID=441375 RepID=B6AJE4_CRYMR|nr:ubiquitin carboxyl-terminal hydrolase family protein [Cryptosporidium muris RN66]EEA08335.1 ubiquitin carboxyl-terminal hydrolase family protein [Cryptosporidium muris RN66]|eukprot:XP_002142684.1 ubiquitin carboxyl-terminal hydrolase family protein [Cryptosporidium muris RN66]
MNNKEDFDLIELSNSVCNDVKRSIYFWKSECQLSFKNALSLGGLYVNLMTFEAFSEQYLMWDYKCRGCKLYLNVLAERKYKDDIILFKDDILNPDLKFFDIEYSYQIVILPNMIRIPINDPIIPDCLKELIQHITDNSSINSDQSHYIALTEDRKITKHAATLFQIDNPKPVVSSGWKCEVCSATNNLWLNLSDGFIGCGRKLYGVGGGCKDGSEGAALLHYKMFPDRPLVVKLGTITPLGNADVFSYDKDEDDLVIDPNLIDHLAHFQINIGLLRKCDKSVAEMQSEHNATFNWSFSDSNNELERISGPGFVGLENLGNSCYMNSIFQVMSYISEIKVLFVDLFQNILENFLRYDTDKKVNEDLILQYAKVNIALITDEVKIERERRVNKYKNNIDSLISKIESLDIPKEAIISRIITEEDSYDYVSPIQLKNVVTKGHCEFSSAHQQDAEEFLTYFMGKLNSHLELLANSPDELIMEASKRMARCFLYEQVERLECEQSKQVRYLAETTHILSLSMPSELDISPIRTLKKQRQSDESILNCIDLMDLIKGWTQEDTIENFLSPATNKVGKANRRNFMKTMPPYLIIHLKRFYLSDSWKPLKINDKVKVPDILDIEFLRRSDSLAPGEIAFTNIDELPNEDLIRSIEELGFTRNHAILAFRETKSSESDVCLNWILSNIDNIEEFKYMEGISDTLPLNDDINTIISVCCCPHDIAKAALCKFGNVETAIQMILDGSMHIQTHDIKINTPQITKNIDDGYGKYELTAVVCHLGKNAHSGHYVSFIKKIMDNGNSSWVLYNDMKVSICKNLEDFKKEYGYLYFYRRVN